MCLSWVCLAGIGKRAGCGTAADDLTPAMAKSSYYPPSSPRGEATRAPAARPSGLEREQSVQNVSEQPRNLEKLMRTSQYD